MRKESGPVIIGFSGGSGVGKTASATMLRKLAGRPASHLEISGALISTVVDWVRHIAFCDEGSACDPLRHLSDTCFRKFRVRISEEWWRQRYDTNIAHVLMRLSVTPNLNKEMMRPILEWVGLGMMEAVRRDFWRNIVRREIRHYLSMGIPLITVAGIRSYEDASMIWECGGEVVRIVAPSRLGSSALASDSWINQWEADIQINNSGSLAELENKLQLLWSGISSGTLR